MTTGVRALFAKLDDEEPIPPRVCMEIVGLSVSQTMRLLSLLASAGDVAIDAYGYITTTAPSKRQATLPIGGAE